MPPTHLPLSLSIISMIICFSGAIFLWLKARENRAKHLLSLLMAVCGLLYLTSALSHLGYQRISFGILSPIALLTGNLIIILTLFYPIEVTRPGWLGWKTIFKILTPFFILTATYFVTLWLLNEPIRTLQTPQDILSYYREFNVWFRFLLYFSIIIYCAYMLTIIYIDEPRYQRWLRENYASTRNMDIQWIQYFGIGVASIVIVYLLLLIGNAPLTLLLQTILIPCFFLFIIFKALFRQNPYPEGYFHQHSIKEMENDSITIDGQHAHSQIFHYKIALEEWMRATKPYLDPNFKLSDTTKILPLPLPTIARLFNLNYGEPFQTVVCKLRIEYSLTLLHAGAFTIAQIAEKSGFGDEETFVEAFTLYNHMTPKQYIETHSTE